MPGRRPGAYWSPGPSRESLLAEDAGPRAAPLLPAGAGVRLVAPATVSVSLHVAGLPQVSLASGVGCRGRTSARVRRRHRRCGSSPVPGSYLSPGDLVHGLLPALGHPRRSRRARRTRRPAHGHDIAVPMHSPIRTRSVRIGAAVLPRSRRWQ